LISHHAAPPGFHRALPPIKYSRDDAHSWETPSPPFRVPTQGSHHSYFVHILYLAYITIISLACSKSAATKMFEIKYEKIPGPAKRQSRPIPLNAASNGRELSEKHSIFALGESEHASSPARIDGIDRTFLFGNARHPMLAPGLHPISPAFGGHTGKPGLSPLINLLY